MDRRGGAVRDDRGETLVELMVAIAILGIAAVAVVSGLILSVKVSTVHRNEASGGAYVRSFAEAIQNYVDSNGLAACGSAAATYAGVSVPNLPSGYATAVTGPQSWTGSAWGSCASDGVQRLQLSVTSTGDSSHRANETLTVILRKPCNGAAATSTDNPCA